MNPTLVLPVSGKQLALRGLAGEDEVVLLGDDRTGAAALCGFLNRLIGAASADRAETLPTPDLDAFVLQVRMNRCGPIVRTDAACPAPDCSQRIDFQFEIADYLEHHRPEHSTAAETDSEAGWFRLRNHGLRFRIPRGEDLIAAEATNDPAGELARRCAPDATDASAIAAVESALDALAPSLARELEGTCPECGAHVLVFFDPRSYCLGELRALAAFLYADVDLLARRYHWSEAEILRLPVSRRKTYVELARSAP